MKRIIPSHMENNIQSSSTEFRRAFGFLENKGGALQEDYRLLNLVSVLFTKLGIVAASKVVDE
jgi:hypothetical protein